MKEYIISVITVTAICALVSFLSPDKETGRHIKLVAGLCTVCVMIAPLSDALRWLSEFDADEMLDIAEPEMDKNEYESIFDNYLSEYRIENTRMGIASMLAERYGKESEDFEVYLSISEGELERVSVFLCGDAIFLDSRDIESYLSDVLGCEVIVAVN